MTSYIALLRGVNVGGHRKVAMSDLRELMDQLGFVGARSLLQSGNLVFRGGARTSGALERLLEAESKKRLDLQTEYFVRTAAEWASVIARNPFREAAKRDPAHLVVMFAKSAPSEAGVKALQAAISGPETVRAKDRHIYIVYPAGIGRSLLTTTLLEKRLATRLTGRNWNTILKLAGVAAV